MEETLEAFEGLVEVTEDPLFPADIDTVIENVEKILSLLEADLLLRRGRDLDNVLHINSQHACLHNS